MRLGIVAISTTAVHAAFSCMLLCAKRATAQSQLGLPIGALDHTAWSIREGAPSAIAALAQSADGVLWLGSRGGLYRFDGVHFDAFDPLGAPPLPSLTINALLAAPDTSLWIGYAGGGVSVVARGQVVSYNQRDGLPEGTVTAIARDSAGDIWVATTTGLAQLHAGRWNRYGREDGYPGGMTPDLLVDRRGTVWASTNAGVFTLSRAASQFVRRAPSLDPGGVGVGQPREAPDGSVWGASTRLGLTRLSDSLGRPVPARAWIAGLRQTLGLFVDHRANAWLIEPSGFHRVALGMNRVNPEKTALLAVEQAPLTTGGNANAVFEDREDNIWVATDGGIERFRETKFTPILLPNPTAVPSVAPAANGSLWLGRYGLPTLAVRDGAVVVVGGPANITCSYRDRAGDVWLGGPSGMWHLRARRQSLGTDFARVSLSVALRASDCYAIATTSRGDLWASLRGARAKGVFRRRGANWSSAPLPPSFSNQVALTVVTDSADRVWLGFPGNRLVLVTAEDSVHVYSQEIGLHVGSVTALLVRGGRLWIGGESGLTMLNGDGGLQSITATEPLRGITGIVETSDGDVWLNGVGGVTHIEAAEVRRALANAAYRARIERFDYHDGLPGQAPQFRPLPTAIEGTDGRLWFTTERGVAWIDPSHVRRNRLAPLVQIRAVNVAGKPYGVGNRIALPARTTDLDVAYTALSLGMPDRVKFRYRLAGADTAWTEAGNRRQAFYTNLGPGSYRFQVIAANEDGVWNDSGAGVDIEIPPTFTQTKSFTFLLVAAALWALWGIARWRQRQIARALRTQFDATLAERARVARELHDTLLQGFAGVTLQLKRAELALPDQPDVAAETIMHVQQLARTSLREARERVWDMSETDLGSGDLSSALEAIARERTVESGIDVTVSTVGERRRLPRAVEDGAFRIGREALVNAVRHAAARRIDIQLSFEPQRLRLEVRDDGRGFSPEEAEEARRRGHFGLNGARERAMQLGGRCDISARAGSGTVVSLELPLNGARSR